MLGVPKLAAREGKKRKFVGLLVRAKNFQLIFELYKTGAIWKYYLKDLSRLSRLLEMEGITIQSWTRMNKQQAQLPPTIF